MARLVVNPGSPSAWEAPLKPGANYVGRGFANDIKIPDPSVSGSHCEILVDNLSVVIKDLGSTNGTFVNRSQVRETTLQPGQTIHLGSVELLFISDAAAAANLPPPPSPTAARIVSLPAATAAAPPGPARPAPVAATATVSVAAPPPPIPPPIAAPKGSGNCKHHPRTLGRFFCNQCRQYYCELCVNSHNVGGASHKFCRACGFECTPVQAPVVQSQTPKAGFFSLAFGAFQYPLKGDGIVLLIAGTFFFSIIDAAKFFARFAGLFGLVAIMILFILGTGYLTCYLRRIVTSSAMGEAKMPDWPDVSDLSSDILGPFFQLVGMTFVCFLPTIVVAIFVAKGHEEFAWVIIAAVVLGCIYYPMAFLAVAMLDTVFAVNPLVVVPTMFKVPLEYFMTLFLFGAAFLVTWIGDAFLPLVIPLRFVSAIISSFVGLYLLTVEMRVLGLLYFTNKHRFGWLNR